MKRFTFDELAEAPLIVDAIYEGGLEKNVKDDPIHKLLPGTGNLGGFRVAYQTKKGCTHFQHSSCPAYVVLYTSKQEVEWPDHLDYPTGQFTYYGDNREPGHELHDTKKGGNLLLRDSFKLLHGSPADRKHVPAFLLFEKSGPGRSVKFLGLAAPGYPTLQRDHDLVAIWRSKGSDRFQNYKAVFTVVDTGNEPISRAWLDALKMGKGDDADFCPEAWRSFIEGGVEGLRPLASAEVRHFRSKLQQLPEDRAGIRMLQSIINYFADNPVGFELCAVTLIQMMDANFRDFDLTRPWRDGGRDAVGSYVISAPGESLPVECALEAKCYNTASSVGVKATSRLISRLKYRQFGILVTTSYVNSQAYEEIKADEHPVLIVSGRDIVDVLRRNNLHEANLKKWLTAF